MENAKDKTKKNTNRQTTVNSSQNRKLKTPSKPWDVPEG